MICVSPKKNKYQFLLVIAFILFAAITVNAQQRIVQSINTNWQFYKGEINGYPAQEAKDIKWENVSIPHSYNTADVLDDEKGYYRGVAWYRKKIYLPASYKNKIVYLRFEAASQVASVYVNGKLKATHTGGYNGFVVPVNDALNWEKDGVNEIAVKVDNQHDENIPPLSADFSFFGGIYRDVYLEALNPVHFDADNYGSQGVFISTPLVSDEKATVLVKGAFVNQSAQKKSLLITTIITDAQGNLVAQQQSKQDLKAGQQITFNQTLSDISKPHLWSPGDPYLYRITSSIYDKATKELLDEVTNPLGFRWFSFTADKGFFLNGKPLKLWGASRHQDYKNMANALPDALHVKDIRLLKEMGANFLRVAHYPQDPAVLEACDRLGIITSVEIPIVNTITETPAFRANCLLMQTEMIRQLFNHPSIVIWAYMNEVLLQPRYDKNTVERENYIKQVSILAKAIDSLSRAEDPSRYTMIPFHGDLDLYIKSGLAQVPQVVGWNQYAGWYSTDINNFAANMDRHHRELPGKPVMVTEYGADGDPRLHGFEPERFDKTIEYETYLHKVYINAISERAFISGGVMWNLADFSAEARSEAMPHINTKGLLTIDRQPKDPYYYYQARLKKEPFIKIGSHNWILRSGIAEANDKLYCVQAVQVFSNRPLVSLSVNGQLLGEKKTEDGIAVFDVPFIDGINQLEAIAVADSKTYKDFTEIKFLLQPKQLDSDILPFSEINISLGDKRYYVDEKLQQVWLPEQAYEPGGWGYIGGKVFVIKNTRRQPYGSDKNILGTEDDPVYETQRIGIEQFRLDVPDGKYEVTLHFAELLSDKERESLVYNLDSNATAQKEKADRQFDVLINDEKVIEGLGNNNYLLPVTAYSTKLTVDIKDKKGMVITFKAIKGETILNGLQVRRIF